MPDVRHRPCQSLHALEPRLRTACDELDRGLILTQTLPQQNAVGHNLTCPGRDHAVQHIVHARVRHHVARAVHHLACRNQTLSKKPS